MNEKVLLSGYVGAIAYGSVKVAGVEIQWYGHPITVGGSYYTRGVYADFSPCETWAAAATDLSKWRYNCTASPEGISE